MAGAFVWPLVEIYGFEVEYDKAEVPTDLAWTTYWHTGRTAVTMTGRRRGGGTITIRAAVHSHADLDRAIGYAVQRIATMPTGVDEEEHEHLAGAWHMCGQHVELAP